MVNTSCWVEGGVVSNWARGRLLLSRGGYVYVLFLFDDTAPTEIYTLSLHDALPIFMLDFQAARWLMEKDVAKQAGNNHPTSIPTGVFKTSDGYINIATTGGRIWERCAQAIGAPELVTNPEFGKPSHPSGRPAGDAIAHAKQNGGAAAGVRRADRGGSGRVRIYRGRNR